MGTKWGAKVIVGTLAMAALLVLGTVGARRALSARLQGKAPNDVSNVFPRLSARTGSRQALPAGREVEVMFIGASFCHAAGRADLAAVMDSLRALMVMDAAAEGYHVVFTGVALDWKVTDGLRFLEPFGPFDEIVVGRNWMNSAAVHYIWRDLAGEPQVPQLVIVERTVASGTKGIDVTQERLVERVTGVEHMLQYARDFRAVENAPARAAATGSRP